jgi:hypothetical protein
VDPQDTSLITLWQRQNVWSKAANGLKHDIGRARLWALRFAVAGAVASTASAQFGRWNSTLAWSLGVLAALLLGLSPVVGGRATSQMTRDWTRVRSVSEALKTQIYSYLAGVAPYRGADRRQALQNNVEQIVADQPDLTRYIAGIEPDNRELPAVQDVPSFITGRLNSQIDGYYRPKAAEFRQRLRNLRVVEFVLSLFAAALAAVTGFFPEGGLSAWVAVLTTIGAAITAHAAAQRYEYQQVEFTRTVNQLEDLRTRYEIGPRDERADDELVAQCEQVISIQNDGWMTKLARGDEPA